MPWVSPKPNFITALILPDVQFFRHRKMIPGVKKKKKWTTFSKSASQDELKT